jgi:L-ascorbate metabolism protein UlaG (beta-lactamase superfamily)
VASVHYVGHATTLIEIDGVRLLTDPLLRRHVGHLKRLVPFGDDLPPPDAVLLSHLHADHLHIPSLRRLGRRVPLLVPRGAGWLLRRQGFRNVVQLGTGDSTDVGGIAIEAVPALHDGRRYPFGRQIAANGYMVTGSRSLYFAGDTDLFEAMSELAGADAALLPVSGWGATVGPGHLDPDRAAEALSLLRPGLAIPIHWGTYAPWHWRISGHEPPHADPAAAFAAAAARTAPDVNVRILRPGERTEF